MISQASAQLLNLTNCVYNLRTNTVDYYGDLESCLNLEFEDDEYLELPLDNFAFEFGMPRLLDALTYETA